MTDKIREAFNQWLSTANDADFVTLETAWTAGYQARDRELRAELEAAKKDAERYRWLRSTLESAKGSASVEVNAELAYYETPEEGKQVRIQWYPDTPIGFYVSEAETLDAAIDAAMSEVK